MSGQERFYGMPLEDVERIRAEGKEVIPIGRDVPWHVTEEIMERCFPDPERQLIVYKGILEQLRKDNRIRKSFFDLTPENGDPSLRVVDLNAYRDSRASTLE